MPDDTPEHLAALRAPLQRLLRALERQQAIAQRLGRELDDATQLQLYQTRSRLQALNERLQEETK